MYDSDPIQEQDLFSSDTDDCEALLSDDEASSSTSEVDDFVLVSSPPKLPPAMSSTMSFMKKVYKEEVGNLADDFKLLTVGIHAIMLQSGFVCFDPDSGNKIDGFRLPNNWDNKYSSTRYLCYTVPELLDLGFIAVERVVFRFQNSEDCVNIHGSLSDKESVEHHLILNLNRFVIPLDLAFVNCDMIEARIKIHGSSSDQYPENEIFEFHKLVNDALVYPLLIDLHERAGLVLPPCFMRLPVEIKFEIVELLDGVDIARLACVCSELRNLTSDDDLWKRKFIKDFRIFQPIVVPPLMGCWKKFYASTWKVSIHLSGFSRNLLRRS
ncbi:hypothetical protein Pint_33629 [Pistacia integerrima]|uniref:Uncharacterized protein n=1 Tax=Pistacia integerrima TaxID=434235 RepID=A0ACC0X4A3_9ROSI|nr:hypothetical protein Pint_33629 [Pistacia integerrima]